MENYTVYVPRLVQRKEKFAPGHRACIGCGEALAVKIAFKALGNNVIVVSATGCVGEPQETEEAAPHWTPIDAVPFDQMWADDTLWFPHLLSGQPFHGRFLFDGDVLLGHEIVLDAI